MNAHPRTTLWARLKFMIGVFLIFMLFAALGISFIPVKYTAKTIISFTPKSQNLSDINTPNDLATYDNKNINQSLARIYEKQFLEEIITQAKLTDRKELNPLKNENRAKAVIIYEKIKGIKIPKTEKEVLHSIINQMINETRAEILYPNTVEINYTSASPYLARFIANAIIKKLKQNPNPAYNITIQKNADLPKIISSPNIIYSLYCSAIGGILLALLATIFIKPRIKVIKNGNGQTTKKLS